MATQNNRPAVLLVVFSGLLLISLACNLPSASALPQPTPTPAAAAAVPTPNPGSPRTASDCMDGIQPGKASRAEAIKLLGEPQNTSQDSGLEILAYATSNPSQFNTLAIQNDIVTQVNEFVDTNSGPAWSAIQQQVGEPEKTTYSYYLDSTMTYIYASQGLAYVADNNMDLVFIKSCFTPMSIDDYMRTLGSALPLENPYIK
jgi:hypothetical protein